MNDNQTASTMLAAFIQHVENTQKITCYICGEDASNSEQIIIEDGIPLEICLSCGGNSCGPY